MKAIFLCSMFLFFSVMLLAQTKTSRKALKAEKLEADYAKMVTFVDSGYYTFIAQKANPQGMQQVDLTTHTAFLKLMADSAEVYLPYYGRTYNPTFGGDGGIKTNGKCADFKKVNLDEKHKIKVTFKVKGNPDSYDFMLEIQASGSANLVVNSNKFATISYFGRIDSPVVPKTK